MICFLNEMSDWFIISVSEVNVMGEAMHNEEGNTGYQICGFEKYKVDRHQG